MRKKKVLIIILAIVAVLAGICAIYLCDCYKADSGAVNAFVSGIDVEREELSQGGYAYVPNEAKTGLIFYGGGKVEHTAYEPLAATLAAEGVLCAVVKMPFNLAVFDVNAADGIRENYPQIENWYIGGHSLGGSMAALYLASHASDFEGLILLGSYSTADISSTDLKVLSVYGSCDKVLSMDKYVQNKSNLPQSFAETVIDGGCHAYFGMYGAQSGDGTPTVTNEEQISITVNAILGFVGEE